MGGPLTLFTVSALLVALPLQAAPPAVVDDAGALGQGDCEAVFAAERARASTGGGTLRASAFGLEAACGLGRGLQLGLGVSQARADDARLDATGVSLKYRLVGDDEAPTALTLLAGTGRERSRPDGGRARGWELGLALTQSLGSGWALNANLLRAEARADGERSRSSAWGLGLESAWGDRITGFVELAGGSGGERLGGGGLRLAAGDWTLGAAWHRSRGESRATVLSFSAVLGF